MAQKRRDYQQFLKNDKTFTNRLLIFTPSRGTVRMEWVIHRFGQLIPPNWSQVMLTEFLNPYVPIEFQLADAQNLMAKVVVEGDYEWVVFIEDDNMAPPDAFVKLNNYMVEGKTPVVSGLYYTKTNPPEPLVYRGRGNGYYGDFKLGDKVWCDGIPFGYQLMHASLIKAVWDDSDEYVVKGQTTRRVFSQPSDMFYDPVNGGMATNGGTTDLEWCTRLMKGNYFAKAGWPEIQKMKYPFLVDTNLLVTHIDQNGNQYPLELPAKFKPPKNYVPREITN